MSNDIGTLLKSFSNVSDSEKIFSSVNNLLSGDLFWTVKLPTKTFLCMEVDKSKIAFLSLEKEKKPEIKRKVFSDKEIRALVVFRNGKLHISPAARFLSEQLGKQNEPL